MLQIVPCERVFIMTAGSELAWHMREVGTEQASA